MNERKEHLVADFVKIKPTPCPWDNQRAFVQDGNQVCLHVRVEISKDSRPHYLENDGYYVWKEKGIWKSTRK